ncbi:D-cysteine desulfhydrase family protein [soil metagenome]
MRALARWLPSLAAQVPWFPLGEWPTPLSRRMVDGRPLWFKHEGDSHPTYGGNKLRTLEMWFGLARERGARRIWAIGAYGSNHAIATLVHAERAGLEAGALLFPQPATSWARENAGAMVANGAPIVGMRSIVELPFRGMWATRDRAALVMPPGGATTVGTFGAANAIFELALQISDEKTAIPPPARIVVPIGSACTTAGLLAGLVLARACGAWPWDLPIIHGVRVTPWPITSRVRIANLARATLARAAELDPLAGKRGMIDELLDMRVLLKQLVVDGAELGKGYGQPTLAALRAEAELAGGPRLDGVYSAKAAAALLRLHRAGVGPLLFWSTKSTTVLDTPDDAELAHANRAIRRWMQS